MVCNVVLSLSFGYELCNLELLSKHKYITIGNKTYYFQRQSSSVVSIPFYSFPLNASVVIDGLLECIAGH